MNADRREFKQMRLNVPARLEGSRLPAPKAFGGCNPIELPTDKADPLPFIPVI
jgi:hypothetical protein